MYAQSQSETLRTAYIQEHHEPGTMGISVNSRTPKAQTEGPRVQDQPELHRETLSKKFRQAEQCTSLIPAFGRQSQVDLCEFQDTLVYVVRPRTARTT